ncbi:MAG: hypothetical protein ACRDZ2_12660 [Ilumatobacteraceae bacterium]
MARRNRVDPWADLHAIDARGLFTGNRGCLVDEAERVVRHHQSRLWITCRTSFRDWRHPLAAPHRWTPLFFLDDAVALAAGHRPCATCRREDHRAFRDAVTVALGADAPVLASEFDARLHAERHRRGRGIDRAGDRLLWHADAAGLPDGTVVVEADGTPALLTGDRAFRFSFEAWRDPTARPRGPQRVLTPPTSVAALRHGFTPTLHPSASSA